LELFSRLEGRRDLDWGEGEGNWLMILKILRGFCGVWGRLKLGWDTGKFGEDCESRLVKSRALFGLAARLRVCLDCVKCQTLFET
jgi:hypothetical protein